MVQDLTKLTIVLLIVGGLLAIAITRPSVFADPLSSSSDTPTAEPTEASVESDGAEVPSLEELEQLAGELAEREAELEKLTAQLAAQEADLNERERKIAQRETEIATRLSAIEVEEDRLDQLRGELEATRAQLTVEQEALRSTWDEVEQDREEIQTAWDELDMAREEVATAQARLTEEQEALAGERAAIQTWEARVNEREQRVQAYLRWSVVATVTSGLLAIPSTMALIVIWKEKQCTAKNQAEPVHSSGNGHGLKSLAYPKDRMTVRASVRENYGPNGGNGKRR